MSGDTRRDDEVAAIKERHRLADVLAAAGVQLHPAGPERFRALCPFHDDHDPSLLVDERDGHFHCFGCGAHGDVIDFVMRREGIGFAEACRRLADLPEAIAPHRGSGRKASRRRERRWDRLTLEEQVVLNTAGAIYQHCLWREPRALAYLRDRGLPDHVIRECALGYSDGHSLAAYLRRRSGLGIAQELGLLRRSDRADGGEPLRELFTDRIVVPEIRGGQFVWFIGRSLDDGNGRPKYLALDGERPILGFERAIGRREVYLCEGPFDYLTAVAWRLAACSPCGTALPAERLGFLARSRVVYGVLDADAAGRSASERFGQMIGPRWRPLALPEGCDLNELAQRPGGRDEFFRRLAEARSAARPEGGARGS